MEGWYVTPRTVIGALSGTAGNSACPRLQTRSKARDNASRLKYYVQLLVASWHLPVYSCSEKFSIRVCIPIKSIRSILSYFFTLWILLLFKILISTTVLYTPHQCLVLVKLHSKRVEKIQNEWRKSLSTWSSTQQKYEWFQIEQFIFW